MARVGPQPYVTLCCLVLCAGIIAEMCTSLTLSTLCQILKSGICFSTYNLEYEHIGYGADLCQLYWLDICVGCTGYMLV
jgi:hypothetical protein